MKKSLSVPVGVAIVLLLGVWLAPSEARGRPRPLMTRLVGTLYPYEKAAAGALHTLTVVHGSRSWLLRVERMNIIGGSQDSGMMLLSRIAPPRLSISGIPEFMQLLDTVNATGKRVVLQGWLDLKMKSLRVAEVQEEPGTAPSAREAAPPPSAAPSAPNPDLPLATQPQE